jgi:hypothetical protein
MTFIQAVARICSRLNKNINDSSVTTRIKNHINDTCLEKWHGYMWSFRFREYPLVLSPVVTSGTVTATNGSQTVTASGTPFSTTAHPGAWIEFTGDSVSAIYRVVAVASTSSLTIEPAYQGTTAAGKSYRLMPTDYLLPSEISDTAQLAVAANGHLLPLTHQLFVPQPPSAPLSAGYPTQASIFNQQVTTSTYSTGTLSGSVDTVTLTGVGTAWLTNVFPGDELTVTGYSAVYRVYAVNSDTSITLYNKLTAAASGASYTVTRQFGKVLRLTPIPDSAYVCFVKALRNYSPMVNEDDTNELLNRYPHAVLEGAMWREAGSSPDPREDSIYMKSERMWMTAQGEDEQLFPAHIPTPIWDSRQGRR